MGLEMKMKKSICIICVLILSLMMGCKPEQKEEETMDVISTKFYIKSYLWRYLKVEDFEPVNLKFLEEQRFENTDLSNYDWMEDYDPDNIAIWGIVWKEGTSSRIDLDRFEIDFSKDMIVYSYNRRIIALFGLDMPIGPDYEEWKNGLVIGAEGQGVVILSKEYTPGIVYLYKVERTPITVPYASVDSIYSEYVQIEK